MRGGIAPRKKTNRIEKINSLIEHLLGPILLTYLQGQKGLTTISKVETSKDMRWAKVWVTILDGNDEKTLGMLAHNLYDIQGELNREMAVKMIPRISFHLDTSPRYAQHLSELFHKIDEDREEEKHDGSN